ncbi:flagellar basal body rod protein FlgC [Planctomycetota bacterium]
MAADSMFGPIDIAISGMRAQNTNMSAIYANVANARTADAGNGQPYRRVEAILKKGNDDAISPVEVDRIAQDTSPFMELYEPGHPYANSDGYVRMPNVSLPKELVNLGIATRAYQANVAMLRRYQQIAESALELLR